MSDDPRLVIEQAAGRFSRDAVVEVLARSPGFTDEWAASLDVQLSLLRDRPAGVACPAAVFAIPLGQRHVAVVRVSDAVTIMTKSDKVPLDWRVLVVRRELYEALGDPFLIDERFPVSPPRSGELATLEWPSEPPPTRTAAQVRAVIEGGDAAFLLGAAQVLADGGRVLVERPGPALELVRSLWLLLPDSTRAAAYPASFAFSPRPDFHLLVVPPGARTPADGPAFSSEDECRDYPEGRYETALEVAAFNGDQRELDRLFARRSPRQALGVILAVLAVAAAASLVLRAVGGR